MPFAVPCDARAPEFGVRIGGRDLWLDPRDLILTDVGGTCRPAIMYPPAPLRAVVGKEVAHDHYVLGQPFLVNVLAVFDIGAGQMRFAQRSPY